MTIISHRYTLVLNMAWQGYTIGHYKISPGFEIALNMRLPKHIVAMNMKWHGNTIDYI